MEKTDEMKEILELIQSIGVKKLPFSFIRDMDRKYGTDFSDELKKNGIGHKKKAYSSDYPLPKMDLLYGNDSEGIETMMDHLRSLLEKMQNHPIYPLREAKDIYEYLAHFSEGRKSADEWRKASLDEIRSWLDELAREHSSTQVVLAQCRNIESFVKVNLLTDEEARRKYDDFLRLKKAGLFENIEKCKKYFSVEVLRSAEVIRWFVNHMPVYWSLEQRIEVYNHLMFSFAEDYYEML